MNFDLELLLFLILTRLCWLCGIYLWLFLKFIKSLLEQHLQIFILDLWIEFIHNWFYLKRKLIDVLCVWPCFIFKKVLDYIIHFCKSIIIKILRFQELNLGWIVRIIWSVAYFYKHPAEIIALIMALRFRIDFQLKFPCKIWTWVSNFNEILAINIIKNHILILTDLQWILNIISSSRT